MYRKHQSRVVDVRYWHKADMNALRGSPFFSMA
jgi:hypothetical protein